MLPGIQTAFNSLTLSYQLPTETNYQWQSGLVKALFTAKSTVKLQNGSNMGMT